MEQEVAEEGLRVHFIDKRAHGNITDVELGQPYTAICGETWEPTIKDHETLTTLPLCYGCLAVEYVKTTQLASDIRGMMRDYERQKDNDNSN